MKIGRRGFFKVAAVGAGVAAACAAGASAAEGEGQADGPGMLVDTTLCVGSRACEAASCAPVPRRRRSSRS